jgi:hypothetical protein
MNERMLIYNVNRTFRLPNTTNDALSEYSLKNRMHVSAVLRHAVMEFLKNSNAPLQKVANHDHEK